MWPRHCCPTRVLLGGPWGPLLLTTLKLCLEGGSPGKRENQTKRENNKPRIRDNNSGSKHPPAPGGEGGGGLRGFLLPTDPWFSPASS